MTKPKVTKDPNGLRAEYDFSRGVRGKYTRRFGGRIGVVLDPDVAEVFEDSKSVNAVLRPIADLVRTARRRRARKGRTRRAG